MVGHDGAVTQWNPVYLQQLTHRSRIFRSDYVRRCQHIQRTQGDVSGGADGGRDKV